MINPPNADFAFYPFSRKHSLIFVPQPSWVACRDKNQFFQFPGKILVGCETKLWSQWFYSGGSSAHNQLYLAHIHWEWDCSRCACFKKYSLTWLRLMLISLWYEHYHKTSSISRTKSQNLNVSCILLQLSSLNLLKPGVKLRMKM